MLSRALRLYWGVIYQAGRDASLFLGSSLFFIAGLIFAAPNRFFSGLIIHTQKMLSSFIRRIREFLFFFDFDGCSHDLALYLRRNGTVRCFLSCGFCFRDNDNGVHGGW